MSVSRRSSDTSNGSRKPRSRRLGLLLGLVALAAVLWGVISILPGGSSDADLVLYNVRRGDLPINVTERGNLESQDSVEVKCQVDDIDGDNLRGTPIIWIIPNGSSVKEGDLLVELDAASLQEMLDRQILDTERAKSEQIQAEVKYENQKTQNATSLAEAELQVELAKLALKQFEDEDGGTFQIELQDIELQIQEAQAGKLIEETNLNGVEQLYKLGYRSDGELAEARLSALRSERQLATAISRRKELVEYKYLKSKLELEGALASAKRNLEQVSRDNEALLAQAKAALDNANEALQKETERLERYKLQLSRCKIYAPQDGMVAYATSNDRWRREEIREGATVRPRQTILTIPNLTRMQVQTAVHESVLDEIRPGLPVTIRVDAFPDKAYKGSVRSVAVLPDQEQFSSSGTKVYPTVVTIDEDVQNLKPGMTAVVEIHVDRLEDVISVPVQAVVQVGREEWCYVVESGSPRKQEVELGRTNEKFVEVTEGLEDGDVVVLNTDSLFDPGHSRKELSPEKGESEMPERDPDEVDETPPGVGPEGSPSPGQVGDARRGPRQGGGGERPSFADRAERREQGRRSGEGPGGERRARRDGESSRRGPGDPSARRRGTAEAVPARSRSGSGGVRPASGGGRSSRGDR